MAEYTIALVAGVPKRLPKNVERIITLTNATSDVTLQSEETAPIILEERVKFRPAQRMTNPQLTSSQNQTVRVAIDLDFEFPGQAAQAVNVSNLNATAVEDFRTAVRDALSPKNIDTGQFALSVSGTATGAIAQRPDAESVREIIFTVEGGECTINDENGVQGARFPVGGPYSVKTQARVNFRTIAAASTIRWMELY